MKKHMTRTREILRLLGYLIMALAAWYHLPWLILLGFLVIVFAWFGIRSLKDADPT